jgi:hypothetical protein
MSSTHDEMTKAHYIQNRSGLFGEKYRNFEIEE